MGTGAMLPLCPSVFVTRTMCLLFSPEMGFVVGTWPVSLAVWVQRCDLKGCEPKNHVPFTGKENVPLFPLPLTTGWKADAV